MQNLQNPEVLKKPFCDTGDKNTIPSAATGSQLASLEEGFPQITQEPTESGGIPPERADFNGIFNLLSKQNFAVQNGWLPTFNTEVSNAIGGYAEGACLWYMPTSGTYEGQVIMLKSLIGNNTYDFRADPDGYIGTYWEIVTSAGSASFPLLTFMNADHILNDSSWLRADTFSWQSGAVYKSAYKHLEADINGTTAQTETIAGTTITFHRAADDHKIVLADQEANVEAIYQATGIAWYFILDTTNERFKLPRNIYGFTGFRGQAGNYVAPSSPALQHYHIFGNNNNDNGGTFTATNNTGVGGTLATVNGVTGYRGWNGSGGGGRFTPTSAGYGGNMITSLANFTETGGTVQPPAVQTYLYFYVGNTVQNETTVDVGALTDALNGKADTDLSNLNTTGKETVAGLALPSSRSVALTLGANGAVYTAPGHGWFVAGKIVGTGTFIRLTNTTTGFISEESSQVTAAYPVICVPAHKGNSVRLNYNYTGDGFIKFIYAEGAE